jgi:hypothetical protein
MAWYTTNQKVFVIKTFCSFGLLVNVTVQVEVCFLGEPCDIQGPPDCPPVAPRTPSQKFNVSMFRLPAVADPAAFCTETNKSSWHIFMQCWLEPKSVVLNVAHFFLLCPVLHRQPLSYEQMRYVYVPSYIYHTHFLFLLTVQQSGR